MSDNTKKIKQLESIFINKLKETSISYRINGENRIPGVFNITFNDIDGKKLVIQLDMLGVGISFGAACASGTMKNSAMLMDIGLTEKESSSTVRISWGKIHSNEDVNFVVKSIENIINQKLINV